MSLEIEETYQLQFYSNSKNNWEGANIVVRVVSIGEMIQMVSQLQHVRTSPLLSEEEYGEVRKLAKWMSTIIQNWELKRKGVLIPVTEEGLLSLGHVRFWEIYNTWMMLTAGVPDPLESKSSDGDMLEVQSIPMEAL